MNISELKAEMARKNISIPKLADLIGINKKTLYSRFSGTTVFNQAEIAAIAKELNLSDEDILNIFFAEKVS
jgi:transcriptional regulator with XRE-family HTH domain